MRTPILAAALAALLVTACDNTADTETPANESSSNDAPGTSGERAQDALGEAGQAARQTLESLGEAGQAGIEALQENAPEIQEGLSNAGERLRNAAGALVEEPAGSDAPPLDAEGDSERDLNETPEAQETPAQ